MNLDNLLALGIQQVSQRLQIGNDCTFLHFASSAFWVNFRIFEDTEIIERDNTIKHPKKHKRRGVLGNFLAFHNDVWFENLISRVSRNLIPNLRSKFQTIFDTKDFFRKRKHQSNNILNLFEYNSMFSDLKIKSSLSVVG